VARVRRYCERRELGNRKEDGDKEDYECETLLELHIHQFTCSKDHVFTPVHVPVSSKKIRKHCPNDKVTVSAVSLQEVAPAPTEHESEVFEKVPVQVEAV
jgi:hypothetical protein